MAFFRITACFLALVALGGCATKTGETMTRWDAQWDEREQRYDSKAVSAQNLIDLESNGLRQAMLAGEKDGSLERFTTLEYELAKAIAQREVIRSYRKLLATNPTPGIFDSWLTDQIALLAQISDEYTTHWNGFLETYVNSDVVPANFSNWPEEVKVSFRMRGLFDGGKEELQRVNREYGFYAQEVQQAEIADEIQRQKVSNALSQMGQQMQTYSFQQQLLNQQQTPTVCNTIGNTTVCN